jgi:hypothetical protein
MVFAALGMTMLLEDLVEGTAFVLCYEYAGK